MERAGTLLKKERERQQKSLREIAEATKIGISVLQALEGDRIEFLPPPSYTRGFIKIYAKELGLDPDMVLRIYEQERLLQHRWEAERELVCKYKQNVLSTLVLCTAIAICVASLFIFFLGDKITLMPKASIPTRESIHAPLITSNGTPDEPAAGFVQSSNRTVAAEPAVPPSMQPAPDTAPQVQVPCAVTFKAHDLTWIRVHADDRPAVQIMLKPGEKYDIQGARRVRARIGNPAGVTVLLNDRPVSLTVERGKPVNLELP